METLSIGWVLALAWLAGLAIPLGALIASSVVLRDVCLRLQLDSFVSYFGGGALLAAITLVLVPAGAEDLSMVAALTAFAAGGVVFWQFSVWAKRTQTRTGIFIGMLLDFVPEALLLGVFAASDAGMAFLLAGLIALQNMPEGFAGYREMTESIPSRMRLLLIFLAASVLGPLAAWLGHVHLTESEAVLGLILLFCSGGILYLIFEDIAPNAHSKSVSFPAIGAICGFLLGMAGTMLVH